MMELLKRRKKSIEIPDICTEHKKIAIKLSRIEGENLSILAMLAIILVIVLEKVI